MNYDSHVKIAADSVGQLRRCDVFRLLDTAPPSELAGLARWLASERPELTGEIIMCKRDIEAERATK